MRPSFTRLPLPSHKRAVRSMSQCLERAAVPTFACMSENMHQLRQELRLATFKRGSCCNGASKKRRAM